MMALQDGDFFINRRITHRNLHEKAVGLRLWQFVSTLLFHWVLRGNDGVYIAHAMRLTIDGHLPFLHYLKQSCLCLGRSTVYLIDQHDIGKHGSRMEIERLRLHVEHRRAKHIARHEIGRELYATEACIDESGNESCQQCLCHTWHTFNEHMAIGQNSREDKVDCLLLSHNDASDVLP